MATKAKSGQSKSSAAIRKAQNKDVKDGTIRRGAAGKADRKYNAKTGRWEIVRLGSTARSGPRTTARASTVSPQKRGEGSQRSLTKRPVEFGRGIGAQQGLTSTQKSKNLRDAKNKAAYDRSPRGQKRNVEGLVTLASIVGGGIAGGAARGLATGSRVIPRVIGSTTKPKAINRGPAPKAITSGKNKK